MQIVFLRTATYGFQITSCKIISNLRQLSFKWTAACSCYEYAA